jgi:membrane protein YqaA with SNARE-associated domain
MSNSCNPRILKRVEVLSVVFGLVIVAIFLYSLTNMQSIEEDLKEEVYYYGVPGIFLVSAILDFIPQFFSPFIILATVIVAGLNVHLAIFIVTAGSTVGSVIGFILGKKYMFRIVDCLVAPKKVKQMTELMNKHGKWIVPVAAITPLPYVPIVFGALNFSKNNFIIYGLIPRAIGLIIAGYLIALI